MQNTENADQPTTTASATPDKVRGFVDIRPRDDNGRFKPKQIEASAQPENVRETVINLATPIRSERVRGFQPPWRTVYVYRCANGHEMRIRANSFIGRNPTPGIGGVYCNQCKP